MYQGLPDPNNPLIWVHEDDLDAFQDNTSIDALPDDGAGDGTADDGIQDAIVDPCGPNTNLLNGASDVQSLDTDLRTESERGDPLINLNDVKPGDFGEATLSLHLCDNPGYIWMFANNIAWAENGENEPEAADGDSVGPADEEGSTADGDDLSTAQVELLDAIQTMFWYDEDGDNVYEPGGVAGQVDVVVVLDRSNSMTFQAGKFQGAKDGAKLLVDELDDDDQGGLVSFASGVTTDQSLVLMNAANKTDLKGDIQGLTAGGNTDIAGGINAAQTELDANGRADAAPVIVLLSDGEQTVSGDPVAAANNAKAAGIRIFSIAYGTDADDATLQDIASPGDFRNAEQIDEIQQVFAEIARAIEGEKCFLSGSLRETLGVLNSSAPGSQVTGVPLDGNRAEGDFVEVGGDDSDNDGTVDSNLTLDPNAGTDIVADPPTAEGRDCYVNSTTNAIGFAWWLPVDHANEIQTDSVSFDLGFYTEQCRHNTGAGQAPEQNG
jgi:Mg-chelatase subunit ChlD